MTELEKREFEQRVSVLTIEEQILAVKYFEDSVMFAELEKRSRKKNAVISVVSQLIEKRRILKCMLIHFGLGLDAVLWLRLFLSF